MGKGGKQMGLKFSLELSETLWWRVDFRSLRIQCSSLLQLFSYLVGPQVFLVERTVELRVACNKRTAIIDIRTAVVRSRSTVGTICAFSHDKRSMTRDGRRVASR